MGYYWVIGVNLTISISNLNYVPPSLPQGMMSTFLWIPEEHPEEQYTDVQEQAKVGCFICRLEWHSAQRGGICNLWNLGLLVVACERFTSVLFQSLVMLWGSRQRQRYH